MAVAVILQRQRRQLLLLVLLDDLRWTHMRLIRVTSRFTEGSPLTQEVPALI